MSRLLHLLNQLKAEARVDFLTPSQADVATDLDTYWKFPERVNLVGEAGAGKTFLGWSIARSRDGDFLSSPVALTDQSPAQARATIIDNVSGDVRRLRNLLAELQLREVRRALLISREPNQLGLPVVTLNLPTREDIDTVYHHLSLLECYALEPLRQGNLWQVIFSTLTISHKREAP